MDDNRVIDLDQILDGIPEADIETIVAEVLKSGDFDATREAGSVLPYMRKVGINDLVPQEYQNRLMQLDLIMSNCHWEIGDIANELINSVNRKRASELGKVVSMTDIFEAVGFFCHRTARSVRYYYECARYFPPAIRAKYENVGFNVFATARWVKDWELMLQIADGNPDYSAERVRMEYYRQMGETPPGRSPKWDKSPVLSGDNAPVRDDLPLPEEGEVWHGQAQGRFKAVLLAKLDHTICDLREVLDRIPLPSSIRLRIGDAILEIQDIGMQIRREA